MRVSEPTPHWRDCYLQRFLQGLDAQLQVRDCDGRSVSGRRCRYWLSRLEADLLRGLSKLPIRPSLSAWKPGQARLGSSAMRAVPLSNHADPQRTRTTSSRDLPGRVKARRWQCTSGTCDLPLASSEIHTEMVHRLKPPRSKPESFSPGHPDEPPSSSGRLGLVPGIILCSQGRAGCNNQSSHLYRHSKASAEWFRLIHADYARSLEAFLALVFAPSNRARKQHLRSHCLRRVRRRAGRALGCHLSGSTPSRTVGRSRTPLNQRQPVRRGHAIRLASGPSSARGRTRYLHGRIAPCGGMLHWPR